MNYEFEINEGYPTEETLDAIGLWPMEKGWHELMAAIQEIWHWGDDWYSETNGEDSLDRPYTDYRFATGGWSGNEDIIQALSENHLFWMINWYSSKRGGEYVFRILQHGK